MLQSVDESQGEQERDESMGSKMEKEAYNVENYQGSVRYPHDTAHLAFLDLCNAVVDGSRVWVCESDSTREHPGSDPDGQKLESLDPIPDFQRVA